MFLCFLGRRSTQLRQGSVLSAVWKCPRLTEHDLEKRIIKRKRWLEAGGSELGITQAWLEPCLCSRWLPSAEHSGKRRERECRSTREAIRFAGKLLQSVLTELTDTLEEESSGCSSDCRDGQEEG